MIFYANQKVIRVIKSAADKDHPYSMYNKTALLTAMQKLTPNAFKLWCYIGSNMSGYEFALSSIDVQPKCNMSRSTYYSTVKELEEKGYLMRVELKENLTGYLFLEEGSLEEKENWEL